MVLSEIDRGLLQRCLTRQPHSWEAFVDRFLGLVLHVINHTAQARLISLNDADREDLAADVFMAIVQDDFAVLRHFRGQSSLATYLTVIARRVVVRELVKRRPASHGQRSPHPLSADDATAPREDLEKRLTDRDEVERLMSHLDSVEAALVRMYHLEGMSYREISHHMGIPENSVGPALSRARTKMRRSATPNSTMI